MEELRKQWITSEKEYREGEVFVYRQKFTASQVKKAVFYGTALGVYEAELNGTKIGRQMFAPGFSYYPRRVLYQTHEVTKLLREGENTLTVYLGQGWYCGRFLCENQTQIYGEQPAVAWILELEDAAGSRKIVSDETVEELESPYEYAGEYDGEIYFADGRENVTGHAAAYTKETPFALEPTLTEVRLQDEMSVRETMVQGDVTIGENSGIWYNAVVRGDRDSIVIGKESNIQDNAVVHLGSGYPVEIGDHVTIGHGAIVHGCKIGDNTMIGMGAILMNGCKIGKNCIIGAGALVTQNVEIPDNSLVVGNPGKVKRAVTEEEIRWNLENAQLYVDEAQEEIKRAFP